jgi:hypothetical protein
LNEDARSEIEEVIAAFYAAFDNRGGRMPSASQFRDLFLSDGRVTRVSGERIESWAIDDFFAPRETLLTDGTLRDFHEWETSGRTTILESIATRESHYQKSGVLNGSLYKGEGRKLIQLCRTGERWVIVSVLWEDL